ncbi:MAG: hypothetical protein ACLR4Z_09915 [Butyricicoccaceae bacterium]
MMYYVTHRPSLPRGVHRERARLHFAAHCRRGQARVQECCVLTHSARMRSRQTRRFSRCSSTISAMVAEREEDESLPPVELTVGGGLRPGRQRRGGTRTGARAD